MARAKGSPKVGGRVKGTPNKATRDVRALAGQYTDEAIKTLAHIMQHGETEPGRIAAARELLDRAHGKAAQPVTGAGGGPLQSHIIISFVATKDLAA